MYGDLPHQAAISHSGGASTMHLASSIQIPAHSFEFAGSDAVLAEKTQPRPQHNRHCPVAVSLRTNELQKYKHRIGDQISILHNEFYAYDRPLAPARAPHSRDRQLSGHFGYNWVRGAFLPRVPLDSRTAYGKVSFREPPLWGWQALQEVRF